MNNIKALIIDDETPAAELISAYLKDHPNIEVLAICNDGFSGVKAIQEHNPDLIFLDVQMPKLTGFEMLELIDNPPAVIFTTAYDEFAIKAFEINAVDYLMKPFSKERFAEALKKAVNKIENLSKENPQNTEIQSVISTPIGNFIERVVVKMNNNITVIPVSKITHIEAYDDYVFIYSEGKRHLKQKTMKYYEEHLNSNKFLRIHRSWIVNVDFIDQIILWEKDTYKVRLKMGEELRASRSGYKKLKEMF
jgi:two-component system, LytTR family, response regulator